MCRGNHLDKRRDLSLHRLGNQDVELSRVLPGSNRGTEWSIPVEPRSVPRRNGVTMRDLRGCNNNPRRKQGFS
jgi:hypothetical protein